MKIGFRGLHPVTEFLFFLLIFIFSLTQTHPVCLFSAVLCGFFYDIKLHGQKALSFLFKIILPFSLLAGIFNGLVNSRGETVLFILPWDSPFTLEAVVFGLVFSLKAAASLIWLNSFNETVTNDKIIFLFGKLSPRIALIISMALRFIPLIISQSEQISSAAKGIGSGTAAASFRDRLKSAVKRLSILVTWTMERGIDTADSMKARGYGLRKRSSFNRYAFSVKDLILFAFSVIAVVFFILSRNSLLCSFDPVIAIPFPDFSALISIIYFIIFMNFPLILDTVEEKKWSIL